MTDALPTAHASLQVAARSQSLSMLSDAFHNLSDVAAAFIALYADRMRGRQGVDARLPFGMARAQVLGAATNAVCLICLSFFLFITAMPRLLAISEAEQLDASAAFVGTAFAGIALNLFSAALLCCGGRDESGAPIHAHAHVTGICHDCGPKDAGPDASHVGNGGNGCTDADCSDCPPATIVDCSELTVEELATPFSFVKKPSRMKALSQPPPPLPPPPPPPPPSPPRRVPWADPALWAVIVHALSDAGASLLGDRGTLTPLACARVSTHHRLTRSALTCSSTHLLIRPLCTAPWAVCVVGILVRELGTGINDDDASGNASGAPGHAHWTAYLDSAVTVFLSVAMALSMRGVVGQSAHVLLEGKAARTQCPCDSDDA